MPDNYREGQDANEPEKNKDTSEGNEPAVETAFLLLKTEAGVEVVTEVGGIDTQRKAGLRDIRDMCHAAYSEAASAATASETVRALMQSMQSARVIPVGAPGIQVVGGNGAGRRN
jgi:hypothetical protein